VAALPGALPRLGARLAAFGRKESGAVALWAALVAPPLIGAAALALDMARVYSLEAEMQTAADALARAGAVELDGQSDAIERATAAIEDLVRNDKRFGESGFSEVTVGAPRFLSALPSSDDQAVPAALVTTDSRNARFVEVTATPENLRTLFPPQLFTGMIKVSVTATSVGSRSGRMCGAAPLFICNPAEDTGQTLGEALESEGFRGRLLKLRGDGQYAPGQFGYLEPPGGNGASELKKLFAEVSPASCYDSAGVTLRTGMISSVDQGMNTRFGVYKGSYKASDYPAANNVSSYPADSCFAAGTCERTGDGVWDFAGYMTTTYPSKGTAVIAGTSYAFNKAAGTATPSDRRPSRYDVYRWELEQAGLSAGDPDRRLMPVAVLNCRSENLSAANVPVQAFAKVFLTAPMGSGEANVIWGEVVGLLKPGADRQARDQVDVRR